MVVGSAALVLLEPIISICPISWFCHRLDRMFSAIYISGCILKKENQEKIQEMLLFTQAGLHILSVCFDAGTSAQENLLLPSTLQ